MSYKEQLNKVNELISILESKRPVMPNKDLTLTLAQINEQFMEYDKAKIAFNKIESTLGKLYESRKTLSSLIIIDDIDYLINKFS
jgi:hypothetical protein